MARFRPALARQRPVDALLPIQPTMQAGSCSRCHHPTDVGNTVRLADGTLAHRYHFHGYDVSNEWADGPTGTWEGGPDADRNPGLG